MNEIFTEKLSVQEIYYIGTLILVLVTLVVSSIFNYKSLKVTMTNSKNPLRDKLYERLSELYSDIFIILEKIHFDILLVSQNAKNPADIDKELKNNVAQLYRLIIRNTHILDQNIVDELTKIIVFLKDYSMLKTQNEIEEYSINYNNKYSHFSDVVRKKTGQDSLMLSIEKINKL